MVGGTRDTGAPTLFEVANVYKDEIKYLDLSLEEASNFIVSAGTSNPN